MNNIRTRLTGKENGSAVTDPRGHGISPEFGLTGPAIERLAAYEDSGLSPEMCRHIAPMFTRGAHKSYRGNPTYALLPEEDMNKLKLTEGVSIARLVKAMQLLQEHEASGRQKVEPHFSPVVAAVLTGW